MIPTKFGDLKNINLDDYIRGIDISRWQGIISDKIWVYLKGLGVEFVYLKATQGTIGQDALVKTNATNAKNNGFKISFYHFADTNTDAKANAINFKNLVDSYKNKLPNDLPLMLDLEDNASSPVRLNKDNYLTWCNDFFSQFINEDFVIYSRTNFLDEHLPEVHNLGCYKLWLSRYNNDASVLKCPHGWDEWYMWQFTDEYSVSGKNFDADLMKK